MIHVYEKMGSMKMMKQVRIGKIDLYVNPIGIETNAIGGHNIYPNLNEETGKM